MKYLVPLILDCRQSENERDTGRGVAVDLLVAVATNIAAGAKIGEAAAETEKAATAGVPPGTTRNTGQW